MCVGSCCMMFVRVLVIVFNVVFFCCGLALIGLGVWLFVDPKVLHVIDLTMAAYNSQLLRDSAILLISMGCLVVVVSVLGLVGAILLNTVLLGIHLALIIIAFCGEIAGGVLAIAFKDWFLQQLKDVLRQYIDEPYYVTQSDPNSGTCQATSVGALWDYLQVQMECCGIESAPKSGYEAARYSFDANCAAVPRGFNKPLTCCVHDSSLTPINTINETTSMTLFRCPEVKTTGCLDALEWWVGHYAPVLIGIGIGVAMLQTIGIIFVVCLCVNSKAVSAGYKRQH